MKKVFSKLIPSYITFKLSLLVSVLVIVAFTLLEVYKFLNAKSQITQQINTEQYAQAQFIATDIQNKIDKQTLFISGLADVITPKIIQSETLLLKTLQNSLKLTNIFPQGVAVFSPSGVGVIAEHPVITGRSTFSFAQSQWFIKAKASKDVVTHTPHISGINGKLLMPMAKAIRDDEGNVLGVLAAPIYLNSPGFMDYIFDKDHRQQGDILVVSRDDSIIVASSDPAILLKSILSLEEHVFYDTVMKGFNGYNQFTSSNDKMLKAAADINNPNWFVVIRTPVKTAFERLNNDFYSAIVNGILVSLVALLTITFTLFLFFIPLRKAAKSVKLMIENPRDLTHIKIYKNDEIGELISGFNLLIDMVNERNTNLKKANAVLESLSQTDGLTGIANRRHFDETLNHTWRVQMRSQQPLTLLLIDIDYFKKYNDAYGHIAGDDCLKKVTKAIKTSINRSTDFFARYGGEEFVILLQGDIKEGIAIAEKVRLIVSELKIEHKDSSFEYLTISLGVASIVPQVDGDPVELVKKADQALYQSKANGRNRYEVVAH